VAGGLGVARHPRVHRLVIGADGSESASRAVAQQERGRQLATQVDEAVAALRRAGCLADRELREGDRADQLIRAATERHADLVVVGARGLHGLGRLLLGSVARNVLLHTSASVLVVRSLRDRAEAKQAAVHAGV
jgi:hypothetical protein